MDGKSCLILLLLNLTLFKFHDFNLFQIALFDTGGVVADMSRYRMTKNIIFTFKEILKTLLSHELAYCHLILSHSTVLSAIISVTFMLFSCILGIVDPHAG